MAPPNVRNQVFSIVLVGDVMLGRLIDQLRPTHVDNPEEHDIVAGFARRMPLLFSDYTAKSPWGNTLPLFHSVKSGAQQG
jgi:hypothetical protein